jgi:hypothetical protein
LWAFSALTIAIYPLARGADAIEAPRIESVVPLPHQPQEDDRATIWYDDFNGPEKQYGESSGLLDGHESLGGSGKSLASVYEKGSQGKGDRKLFFGDFPNGNRIARRGEHFDEIYWRMYVKHQPGWVGGGEAKLSRATSIVSENWRQAMIAHVWSGSGDSLTLDPATGVRDGQIITTKYNDFAKLRWIANKPQSTFAFSSPLEGGWWVCVEARARLNTPGQRDGINQLWIDGRLEAERKNVDFRGTYADHGINALFVESYWNNGSPVTQTRWIDNLVVSTKPIGPVVCPTNPTLIKRKFSGSENIIGWQTEISTDPEGKSVVWKSKIVAGEERMLIDGKSGKFSGDREAKESLAPGLQHYCRARQQTKDGWSEWSGWHQTFLTADAK